MPEYLLSVHITEGAELPSEETMQQMFEQVDRFNEKLKQGGAWVFAGGLHPSHTATVVHAKDGDVLITDGPYAEAKEQLGGFWIIDVPDLDVAIRWATEASAACLGPVEVRPFEGEPETTS